MYYVIAADPSEVSKAALEQKHGYRVTVIARVPFGLPGDEGTQAHAVNCWGSLESPEAIRAVVDSPGYSPPADENARPDGCSWSCLVSFGPQAELRVVPEWCLIKVDDGCRLWVVEEESKEAFRGRSRAFYTDAVSGKRKRFQMPFLSWQSRDERLPTAFVQAADGTIVAVWL